MKCKVLKKTKLFKLKMISVMFLIYYPEFKPNLGIGIKADNLKLVFKVLYSRSVSFTNDKGSPKVT